MPKRKPFVCKVCNRSFSMAAHLARHGRVHAQKGSKSAPKRTRRPAHTRSAVPGQFGTLIAGLNASHRALTAERTALDAQISALESALAVMGAASAPLSGRTTARAPSEYRPGSLKAYIQRVLSDAAAAMPVAEITAAVVRSGFKSKNKTLGTSVGIALANMPTVRRMKRGIYRLR